MGEGTDGWNRELGEHQAPGDTTPGGNVGLTLSISFLEFGTRISEALRLLHGVSW